jgi:hypothetical protein
MNGQANGRKTGIADVLTALPNTNKRGEVEVKSGLVAGRASKIQMSGNHNTAK